MTVAFTPKALKQLKGVRAADKATNRVSFSGTMPWFDIDNLMAPTGLNGNDIEGFVEGESLLELEFIRLARFVGQTVRIRPQPCTLRWVDPRTMKLRKHIPDFEVWRHGSTKSIFIEVKYAEEAELLKSEHDLIRANFKKEGHEFEVWTEAVIRKQPRATNVEMLFAQAGPIENVAALECVRSVLRSAQGETLTIGEIRERSGLRGKAFRAILRLHVRRELVLDLDSTIDERSPVYLDRSRLNLHLGDSVVSGLDV